MPRLPPARCDPRLKYDTHCVQNVWRELSANTHFNINELAHNDVKVPSTLRGERRGERQRKGPVSKRQFGDKSSVIKHFGTIRATAEAGGGGLFDGRWVACLPILVVC